MIDYKEAIKMKGYASKGKDSTILPAVFTLDVRYGEMAGQPYGKSCISLPCRGCQSCQCQCVACRGRNLNLEQINSLDVEKLFVKAMAA